MIITEEDLNAYRRKHHLPIPASSTMAKSKRLSAENERLKAEITKLRAEITELQQQMRQLTMTEVERKQWCRRKTQQLIKEGEISPTPCEVCDSEHTHAHHPDYHDPYNVRFLCPYHHYELHYRQCRERGEDGRFFKMLMDKNQNL